MTDTELVERTVTNGIRCEIAALRGADNVCSHYLAHTIAPAARKVKEVHNVLEQKVDVPFGYAKTSA